ncbi:MAG: hypothetical protein KC483_07065 [Nitrosarchaeum sp.]|nr:hypothetical protein [Nitrosarchaeum sp.]
MVILIPVFSKVKIIKTLKIAKHRFKAMDKIQKKSERWLEFMAGTHVEILNSLEYLWLL